jgi:hypothetical protein
MIREVQGKGMEWVGYVECGMMWYEKKSKILLRKLGKKHV